MNKTYCLTLIILFLWACQSNPNQFDSQSQTPNQEQIQKLSEYKQRLSQFNINELGSISIALQDYLNTFEESPSLLNDLAFFEFKKFHENVLVSIYNDFLTAQIDQQPVDISQINSKLEAFGILATQSEGELILKCKRSFYLKNFSKFLTKLCLSYEKQLSQEQDRPAVEGAAIIIEIKDLVERIVWREKLILDHPDFSQAQELKAELRLLKTLLLQGSDNTPAFAYSSEEQPRRIEKDFEEAYQWAAQKHQHMPIGKTCSQYLSLLKKSNSFLNSEIESFLENQLKD
jgi:hypothetical protein